MKKVLFALAALISTSLVTMAADDLTSVPVHTTESPMGVEVVRPGKHKKITKESTLETLKKLLAEAEDCAKHLHHEKYKDVAEFHISTIKHAIETLEKPDFTDQDKDFFRAFRALSHDALKHVKSLKLKDAKHPKKDHKEEHHAEKEGEKHDKKDHGKGHKKSKKKDHKKEHHADQENHDVKAEGEHDAKAAGDHKDGHDKDAHKKDDHKKEDKKHDGDHGMKAEGDHKDGHDKDTHKKGDHKKEDKKHDGDHAVKHEGGHDTKSKDDHK